MRLHVAVMPRSSTQSSVRRQIGPFQASFHSSGYQGTRRNRSARAVGTRNREKSRLVLCNPIHGIQEEAAPNLNAIIADRRVECR